MENRRKLLKDVNYANKNGTVILKDFQRLSYDEATMKETQVRSQNTGISGLDPGILKSRVYKKLHPKLHQ